MNEDVREIFEGTVYCTLATVSEDGSPWNVPVRFAFDESYLYFRSPAGTTHGSNIANGSRVSIVIMDTTQSVKGAVYLHSEVQRLDEENEKIAIDTFNKRFNNPPDQWPETEYYKIGIGDLDQARTKGRMYYFQARNKYDRQF